MSLRHLPLLIFSFCSEKSVFQNRWKFSLPHIREPILFQLSLASLTLPHLIIWSIPLYPFLCSSISLFFYQLSFPFWNDLLACEKWWIGFLDSRPQLMDAIDSFGQLGYNGYVCTVYRLRVGNGYRWEMDSAMKLMVAHLRRSFSTTPQSLASGLMI